MSWKLCPKIIFEGTRLTLKREQGAMRTLVEESRLTKMELDISDNDVGGAVETIADWMENNRGLYAQ
jgi:hypothetical protein